MIYTYLCVYIHIYIYTCIYICIHVQINIHAHINIYIHSGGIWYASIYLGTSTQASGGEMRGERMGEILKKGVTRCRLRWRGGWGGVRARRKWRRRG